MARKAVNKKVASSGTILLLYLLLYTIFNFPRNI